MYETNVCGICLELLEKTNVCVTRCGHSFCLECIIKNTNYKNNCPNCRKEIVKNINKEEENEENEEEENEEDNEEENEEEENQYNYIGRLDEEDCYHFPIVIEDIETLAKVIREVSGGTFCSDNSLGWILCILSIINDNEESKINYLDDKSIENENLLDEHSKLIIMETIYIYKRSIVLKKHLQNKIK